MIRIIGCDVKKRMQSNLDNTGLSNFVKKKLKIKNITTDEVIRSIPKIFKEKWCYLLDEVGIFVTMFMREILFCKIVFNHDKKIILMLFLYLIILMLYFV